jgi:hypothetical protein
MILFTGLVPDLKVQDRFGWSFVFWTTLLVLVGLCSVLKDISRIFWLIGIKYHRRYKKWMENTSVVIPTNEVEHRPDRFTNVIEDAPVETLDNSQANSVPGGS